MNTGIAGIHFDTGLARVHVEVFKDARHWVFVQSHFIPSLNVFSGCRQLNINTD
jgi:hypothetical protein